MGQPLPRYSAVLLEVAPQVERVSVPPSGTVLPRLRRYTRRGPGAKAPYPAAQEPLVYMSALPEVAEEAGGEAPEVPERAITDDAGGAHSGWLAVALRLGVGVRADEGVDVEVRLVELLGVPVRLAEALGVPVRLDEALGVIERLDEALGVPVCAPVEVGVEEREEEALGVALPVLLDVREMEGLPVAL